MLFNVVAPSTLRLLSKSTFPFVFNVLFNVVAPVTPNVLPKVVAPVAFNVLFTVVAPATVNVLPKVVAPVIPAVPFTVKLLLSFVSPVTSNPPLVIVVLPPILVAPVMFVTPTLVISNAFFLAVVEVPTPISNILSVYDELPLPLYLPKAASLSQLAITLLP